MPDEFDLAAWEAHADRLLQIFITRRAAHKARPDYLRRVLLQDIEREMEAHRAKRPVVHVASDNSEVG